MLTGSAQLVSRAVPPGENNMEVAHARPAGEVFRVFPVPFFVVHEARIRKIARQQNADIRVLVAWSDLGFDVAHQSRPAILLRLSLGKTHRGTG